MEAGMAVSPAVSASVADLRNINISQTPQDLSLRPEADGNEGERQIGASGSRVDATPRQPAVVSVTESSADRGENENPGAAAQNIDSRLPGSGDPNRGIRLDIAV